MTSVLKPIELDIEITSGQLIYVPSPNFSYNLIPECNVLKIPQYQEMFVDGILEIENNASLCLIGKVIVTTPNAYIDNGGFPTYQLPIANTTRLGGVMIGTGIGVSNSGIIYHPEIDGTLHVPETGIINDGKVLMAGNSAGELSWSPVLNYKGTEFRSLNGKEAFINLLNEYTATRNKKLVWIGDSITEQGKNGYGNSIGYTTYIQNMYPNITYVNEGIGGNTTLDVIARLSTILAHNADCYVLAIGINDCRYNDSRGATTQATFISNLTTIIDSLLATNAKVILFSIWPSFYKDQYCNLLRFNTDLRMIDWNCAAALLAETKDIPFIDVWNPIMNYINYNNVDTLIPDGVHPDYTGTLGKKLYAHAILSDKITQGLYNAEYTLNSNTGTFYYMLVIHNGDPGNTRGTGGYCGIKHIGISPYYKEVIAKTGNLSFTNQYLFSYNSGYLGFYNIANDFPMYIMFSTDQIPTYLHTTGIVSGVSNAHRGIRKYDLYHSKDRNAFSNPKHLSWQLAYTEPKVNAIAVNLYPKIRTNVFYKLVVTSFGNSQTTLKLKQIATVLPIRVYYVNATTSTLHRYPLLFTTGVSAESDSLQSTSLPFTLCWEAEENLSSVVLVSYNGSLGAWSLSKSRNESDINTPASSTWKSIATGTGDQTVTLDPWTY